MLGLAIDSSLHKAARWSMTDSASGLPATRTPLIGLLLVRRRKTTDVRRLTDDTAEEGTVTFARVTFARR
jgi:hypothetical protein